MNETTMSYASDSRPALRWWWFANRITPDEIDAQLEWIAANGFGRVEIAWVYPTRPEAPPARFLSDEWRGLVAHAASAATSRGLGCDFTLGTLWPFGGTFIDEQDAARSWNGPSPQRLSRSWEQAYAEPGKILDHLNVHALENYIANLVRALAPALEHATVPALFTDSWEVDPDELWAADLQELFRSTYGYDIRAYLPDIDAHPHRRYDYRALISRLVLERFFAPLTALSNAAGAVARVQCHGAPVDLLDAYALVDVPESETMLFDPAFSAIAASSAALVGTQLVSCEAFTCLYGWRPYPGPSHHLGEELLGDLKLAADAGFANGVSMVVWHGMPFSTPEHEERFYATVHVGPDAAFARELPAFNTYLREVSAALREGETLGAVAQYLPTEEMMMRGGLPDELRRPSAHWHWEMHYVRFREELYGYRPIWTGATSVASATLEAGRIRLGHTTVSAILVDTAWLPASVLAHLLRLAEEGGRIIFLQTPGEPGSPRDAHYTDLLARIPPLLPHPRDLPSRLSETAGPPLVTLQEEPKMRPEFWCRRVRDTAGGEVWRYFFAHPASRTLSYPMPYGVSRTLSPVRLPAILRGPDAALEHELVFAPGGSLLLDVSRDGVHDRTPPFPGDHD